MGPYFIGYMGLLIDEWSDAGYNAKHQGRLCATRQDFGTDYPDGGRAIGDGT